jgi:hypothetical protein
MASGVAEQAAIGLVEGLIVSGQIQGRTVTLQLDRQEYDSPLPDLHCRYGNV